MTGAATFRYAMLAADGPRARAYMQALGAVGAPPAELLLMPGDWTPTVEFGEAERRLAGFDPGEPVGTTARACGVPVKLLESRDINAPETVAAIAGCGAEVVVFCGPAGQILRRHVLATGKKFLHAHPGRLPEFRGSTTIYYSLLMEKGCSVSAIFLNAGIDRGDVVLIRDYPPPSGLNVDLLYDPGIRARTLVDAIRAIAADGAVGSPQEAESPAYYVIHPVLKHIALLGAGCWA